jgi:hypothetical protein
MWLKQLEGKSRPGPSVSQFDKGAALSRLSLCTCLRGNALAPSLEGQTGKASVEVEEGEDGESMRQATQSCSSF